MSIAPKVLRPATRADLEKLPPGWRGEIIDGTLYSFARPRAPHGNAEDMVTDDLKGPFQRGRGGPGGWWILSEPGIELPRAPELSPDLAGWRKERLPKLPRSKPITVIPDWACEILSPSTRSYDQIVKRRFYAEIGVLHIWYIDPLARLLEISRLVDGKWLQLGLYGADEKVHAEPFEAIEINLGEWWEGIEEEEESESE
jgi:Uma2 family endonuclease